MAAILPYKASDNHLIVHSKHIKRDCTAKATFALCLVSATTTPTTPLNRFVTNAIYEPKVAGLIANFFHTALSEDKLVKSWLSKLKPCTFPQISKMREAMLLMFAQIALRRKRLFEQCEDPSQHSGIVYRHEARCMFKPDRIPPKFKDLYKSCLVRLTHPPEKFNVVSKLIYPLKLKSVHDCIQRSQIDILICTDCGGVASLVQMAACASLNPIFSLENISSQFLGYHPAQMDYLLDHAYDDERYLIKGEDQRDLWAHSEKPMHPTRHSILQIGDLCYISNDPRYDNYSTLDKSAFSDPKFQGAGMGWWLVYVGDDLNNNKMYIGFGVDDGPKTLAQWKKILSEEFQEKWDEIPADWKVGRINYYYSPTRTLLPTEQQLS